MSPLDYLRTHLPEVYQPIPDTIVVVTTKDMNFPFKLNGIIHCTGSYIKGNKQIAYIKDYTVDGCIYLGLNDYIFYKTYNPKINKIGKWISDNLLTPMLDNAEMPECKTELVKLRIAINLILSLNISTESKIKWSEWIKELYWNRKAVLHKWYMEEVLPF